MGALVTSNAAGGSATHDDTQRKAPSAHIFFITHFLCRHLAHTYGVPYKNNAVNSGQTWDKIQYCLR